MARNRGAEGKGAVHYVLRLFVAGDAPNSRVARANLQRMCERFDQDQYEVEVVDVTEDAQTALEEGVFVTPALQVIEPGPGTLIFGDLSDKDALGAVFPEEVG
jgi:circadian clock protein KaiB